MYIYIYVYVYVYIYMYIYIYVFLAIHPITYILPHCDCPMISNDIVLNPHKKASFSDKPNVINTLPHTVP